MTSRGVSSGGGVPLRLLRVRIRVGRDSPGRFHTGRIDAGPLSLKHVVRVLGCLPDPGGYGTESHGHLAGHIHRHPAADAEAA
jgi:hypothetical protein